MKNNVFVRILAVPLVMAALMIMAVIAPFVWVVNPKIIKVKDDETKN